MHLWDLLQLAVYCVSCGCPVVLVVVLCEQDLLTNFFKGKFDEKRGFWLVTYRELSKNYASLWFWIDLVRGLPSCVFVRSCICVTCARGSLQHLQLQTSSSVCTCLLCTWIVSVSTHASRRQVSILPYDTLGLVLGSGAVSRLKIIRILRLMRLLKLVSILKSSR
jgi:hypothetical protein